MYFQGQQILKFFERNPIVPPAGPTEGLVEEGMQELQLLVMGESTVEGIGAATFDNSLSVKLAEAIARKRGISVHWKAVGKSGATADSTLKELLPGVAELEKFKVVVLVLGANDSFGLSSPLKWIKHLDALVKRIMQKQPDTLIYLASLPPVGNFPALPQPTRWVLGQCNKLLGKATEIYASHSHRTIYSKSLFENRKHLLCNDGIHPSDEGYAQWANVIADELLPYITTDELKRTTTAARA